MRDRYAEAAIGVEIGGGRIVVTSVSEDFEVLDTTDVRYSADGTGDIDEFVDPDSVTDAAFAAVAQIALACSARGRQVRCLAFGASNEDSVLAVDDSEMAATLAISVPDSSAVAWAWLIQATAGEQIVHSTGFPVHEGSALAKIALLISHDDELRRASWCGLKDYVASKFYGGLVGDLSTASAMGLLDRRSLGWSTAALSSVGLRPDQLPRLVSSDQTFPLTARAAELTSLDAGVPVAVGASGPCLAPLAMGLYRSGAAMVHPGLAGRVCALGSRPTESVLSTVGVGGRWLLVGESVADLRAAGVDVEVIRVGADMRESPEVAEAIVDSQGVSVEISSVVEASAVGAATLAWYAVGGLRSFDATAELFPPWQVFRPGGGVRAQKW